MGLEGHKDKHVSPVDCLLFPPPQVPSESTQDVYHGEMVNKLKDTQMGAAGYTEFVVSKEPLQAGLSSIENAIMKSLGMPQQLSDTSP